MKTKRRRFWQLALLIVVPLVLFAIVSERNSWRPRTMIAPHGNGSYLINFSPDGRYLCLNPSWQDDSFLLYEISSGRLLTFRVANRGGSYFISKKHFMSDRRIYSFPQGKLLAVFPPPMVSNGELSDEKTQLCFSFQTADAGKVFTWDFLSGRPPQPLSTLPTYKKAARSFRLLADRRTLVICDQVSHDYDWHLWFWDVEKRKLVFHGPANSPTVQSTTAGICTWSNQKHEMEVWNYKTGRRLHKFPTDKWGIYELSPDGTLLAVIAKNGGIDLRDTSSGNVIRTLNRQPNDILSLDFSPDGHTLASTGYDGSVIFWRIK